MRPARGNLPLRGAPLHFGSAWPYEAYAEEDLGIIVDVQCGCVLWTLLLSMLTFSRGWSNTLLNSDGILYTTGKLDGTKFKTQSSRTPTQMAFPPAFPPTTESRYEPSTAVKQYSSGRRHVLALSDSGKIWFWAGKKPALQIKFLHLDILEGEQRIGNLHGVVKKVVAGWEESSAYVAGAGIVYWNVFKNGMSQYDIYETDTILLDATIVPGTGFKRRKKQTTDTQSEEHEIGEILNHIVLHQYIVFITDLNKVFATRITTPEVSAESSQPCSTPHNAAFELPVFSSAGRRIIDIQGAFEKFAAFGSDGSVQIGDRHLLDSFFNHQRTPQLNLPRPKTLPALQSSNVISLAFGDHHMHALHSSGRISSYGTEPQGCGALGLGEKSERIFRGVRTLPNRDGRLVPHSEHVPHYIWFEQDKANWLFRLARSSRDDKAAARVRAISTDETLLGEFSEWVEQEGLGWDDFPTIKSDDPDGLGAYFALNVTAAGWHSAALVLVNEDLAEKVKLKHIHGGDKIPPGERYLLVRSEDEQRYTEGFEDEALQIFRYDFYDQPFPRLRLPGGFEMPGGVEFSEWRYGMPPARVGSYSDGGEGPA
jgi:SCF-associated factor 1